MVDYGIALLLLTVFSFVPSSMITYLITERTKEEKQVQIVAGVSPMIYWLTALTWDTLVRLYVCRSSVRSPCQYGSASNR